MTLYKQLIALKQAEIAELKKQLMEYTEPYAKIDITRPDTKTAGACNNDETVGRLSDRATYLGNISDNLASI